MAGQSARPGRRAAGGLEAEILTVLWAAQAPLSPAEIQAALEDLAYNTIHTILTRLVEKGQIVRVSRDGRPAYAPVKDAAQTAADQMRAALAIGTDRAKILANFVTDLSAEDEARLRAALQRARRRPERRG
jgi:predicted transcriptional regulator